MINKLIAATLPYMPKRLVWIFSKKYIAGKTIDDMIKVSKALNNDKIMVTVDLLGEFIKNIDEAEENRNEYFRIIDAVNENNIEGNFSIKPTSFGLLIDEQKCYSYMRDIVAKAAALNNFVRIDMEDSSCIDREIDIYRRLKAEFPQNVGLVIQAYMKRTMNDLKGLMDIHTKDSPLNFRLCKGIYVEPAEIAYKDYDEVNKHYLEDLEFMLKNGIYVGIATHDKYLIRNSFDLIKKYNVPKDMYEFQMLYGVTQNRRNDIVKKGHRMRVYVAFGKKWFGYSTRRLKENPKMASHIIKAIFIRN